MPDSRGTREIGIRIAIGASALGVLGTVLAQGLKTVAIGLAVGTPLADARTVVRYGAGGSADARERRLRAPRRRDARVSRSRAPCDRHRSDRRAPSGLVPSKRCPIRGGRPARRFAAPDRRVLSRRKSPVDVEIAHRRSSTLKRRPGARAKLHDTTGEHEWSAMQQKPDTSSSSTSSSMRRARSSGAAGRTWSSSGSGSCLTRGRSRRSSSISIPADRRCS